MKREKRVVRWEKKQHLLFPAMVTSSDKVIYYLQVLGKEASQKSRNAIVPPAKK